MADLEDLGLIRSPHTSAGRVPTPRGYRFFVDSLLTVKSPSDTDVRRVSAELEGGGDISTLLGKASELLSEATRLAGVVMLPKSSNKALRHVEFLQLSDDRILAVMVFSDKDIQNRVIFTQRPYTATELQQASNYLNQAFAGRELKAVRQKLLSEMSLAREEMNSIMQAAVEIGQKAFDSEGRDDGDYILAGQTNLMGFEELADVKKLRQLFEAFNQKRDILCLLDHALDAQGIQIFIGEESGYNFLDECSVVTSTYEADGEILGVLGIIGPTRMEYERVIPVVDLTAKILGLALKSLH
jgi:heat-inducible transcriptional repressor